MEGKQISDGIIIVQEIIHSLKCLKKHGMLVKIDMSKAYDHISRDYFYRY